MDSTDTESASEIEEDKATETRSVKVQVTNVTPCTHPFSVEVLCQNEKMNAFKFHTGFNNKEHFMKTLRFLLPNLNRSNIKYYDPRTKYYTSTTGLLDSDVSSTSDEDTDTDEEGRLYVARENKFKVEDEVLIIMMKLWMGLKHFDLASRFQCSPGTISRIVITWINYIYLRLGSLNIWPHRDVILNHASAEFKRQYPNTIVIIDCVELKIQTPSARLRQSQTYSSYKSTNTFKCLIGTDSRGAIIFLSNLYTGRISDKEICRRSGFFELLQKKIQSGSVLTGDAIMADKGFLIENELKELGLELNIPPFLGQSARFPEEENIQTRTLAHHRIHVERAIGKCRNFSILERKLPISMCGLINQIWCVCALLSNFQDPV